MPRKYGRLGSLIVLAGLSPGLTAQAQAQIRYVDCRLTDWSEGRSHDYLSVHELVDGRLAPGRPQIKTTLRPLAVRDNPELVSGRLSGARLSFTVEERTGIHHAAFQDMGIQLTRPVENLGARVVASQDHRIIGQWGPWRQSSSGIVFSWNPASLSAYERPFTLIVTEGAAEVSRYEFRLDVPAFRAAAERLRTAAQGQFDGTAFDASRPGGGREDRRCEPVRDCFLTTAAAGAVGLADDCWELAALRAFRDGPLARMSSGAALTADYYAGAPAIVRGINARADSERIWLKTYWTGILPAALAASAGCNRLALAIYGRATRRLRVLADAA